MAFKPFISTGVALASAALIVAGSPALLPAGETAVSASAPAPTKLSNAKYELTALSDITIEGLTDAYYNGWGGWIGSGIDPNVAVPANADGSPSIETDPYFPGINGAVVKTRDPDTGLPTSYVYNQNPVYVTGIPGAVYYLLSNALDDGGIIFPEGIYHYYYEVSAAGGAALPAVIYVAAAQIFGIDSAPAQFAHTVFIDGVVPTLQGVAIGLSTLVPTFNIGPVTLGAGRLVNLYFTGETPDGSYNYGHPGLPAIAGYIAASFANPPETDSVDAKIQSAVPETVNVVNAGNKTLLKTPAATPEKGTTEAGTGTTTGAGTATPDATDGTGTPDAADGTGTPDATPTTVTSPKTARNPLANLPKFEPKKLGGDAGNPFKAVADALSGRGSAKSDDSNGSPKSNDGGDSAKPAKSGSASSGTHAKSTPKKSSDD